MIPLAVRYLRARASFYSQIRYICKKLRVSAYFMMCRCANKAESKLIECAALYDCGKCEYERECVARYDALIDIG